MEMAVNGMMVFLLGSLAFLCLMLMGAVALLGSEIGFMVVIESQTGQAPFWRLAVNSGARV